MPRFRLNPLFTGFCLLPIPTLTSVASNPLSVSEAVKLPQSSSPLHAGIGVLALLLAAIGWIRRCRRQKPS